MKKRTLLAVVITLGLCGWFAGETRAALVSSNAMAAQFVLTALVPATNSPVVTTNVHGVVTTTYKNTTARITSTNILQMLATEFNTNFPAGAQLAYVVTGPNTGFAVVGQNGAFMIPVSSNPNDSGFHFGISNSLVSSTISGVITGRTTVNPATTNNTDMFTEMSPDAGVFYKDSHGNDFHFDGMLTIGISASIAPGANQYNSISILVSGIGSGTFLNPKTGTYDKGVFNRAQVLAIGKGFKL